LIYRHLGLYVFGGGVGGLFNGEAKLLNNRALWFERRSEVSIYINYRYLEYPLYGQPYFEMNFTEPAPGETDQRVRAVRPVDLSPLKKTGQHMWKKPKE
jgi:hypothetical protein